MDESFIYDPTADAVRLKRKREMAKMLQAAALMRNPAMIDAGAMKVANWGDAIAKLGYAWAAGKAGKDFDEDEDRTMRAQNEYTQSKTDQYEKLRRGGTGYFGDDTRALDETGGDSPAPVLGNVPGDPRRAMALAMSSRIPQLIKQAREDQDADMKMLSVPGASVQSRRAAAETGNPQWLEPEPKEHVVGGRVFRDGRPILDARPKFGPPGAIPGIPNSYGQQDLDTGEWDTKNGPAGTTINMGERQVLPAYMKKAEEAQKVTREAVQRTQTNREALNLISKSDTGWGADVIQVGRRLAKTLGVSDDKLEKINSSQGLLSALAPNVLPILQALRPASDTDRAWAQKIQLAELSADPRAMRRALRIIAANDATSIFNAQKDFRNMQQAAPEIAQYLTPFAPDQMPDVRDFDLIEKDGVFFPRMDPAAQPPQPSGYDAVPEKPLTADEIVRMYRKKQ